MEHDSKTCSLACGWAYGCTMLLVAAIIMVKAKHHWNPFMLDTAETTPTATSFCAISIQTFLPRLCGPASVWGVVASLSYNNFLLTVCVCKSECGHVWQPGFLCSWATCLTKLHKAYFSKRFFAPARTRLFGATSCNMARSVSISVMLRHLLGTRDTNVEYLKLITMMMVNDKLLAALWWNHYLGYLRKKIFSLWKIECPVWHVQDSVASHAASHLPRGQNSKGPDLGGHCLHLRPVASRWLCHPQLELEPGHRTVWLNDVKFHLKKKMSCLWFTCDVTSCHYNSARTVETQNHTRVNPHQS